MPTTYYDVTVADEIPHGSDILDKRCVVQFYYQGGSHSEPYSGKVLAWRAPALVRISSQYMNIQDAWKDAEYGLLTVELLTGPLVRRIVGFSRVPDEERREAAEHEADGADREL